MNVSRRDLALLLPGLAGTATAAQAASGLPVLVSKGYEFGDLDEALSSRAIENLTEAVTFARRALLDRQFEHYVQEFGPPAAGSTTGSSTWKA